MKIRDFLNACTDYKHVKIYEYIGNDAIGADPEDYEAVIDTDSMENIPNDYLNRNVEYWFMEDYHIYIYMEG